MRKQPVKKWQYSNPNIDTSLTLAAGLGITPLVAQLLVNRGIETVDEGKTFLYPTYVDLHSPFDMADMDKAVERIRTAIKNGEKICIYGDYDADGTTATALLVNAFRHIDFPVEYYIPHRYDEGYGLNIDAINEVQNSGCKLLITVDCGISSVKEVKYANDCGIDVILTDHHQPPENDTPPAYAIISPKVPGNEYPYTELAGVGLAFKLAQGLIEDEAYLTSLLDLVALGTVVDLAPLTGENRTLSKLGLAEINKLDRVGIRKLWNVAGYSDRQMNGRSLSFGLGPRINAAGRMDTAKKVVDLLTTESAERAEEIASSLNSLNQERKNIEIHIHEKASEQLKEDPKFDEYKGLVVASDDWGDQAKGVVGIVASRLVEDYYRPVFVLVIDGDEATGSGRCIDGMNLADSLNSCSHLLIKHGGHKAAAGVTLKTKNINKFKHAFNEFATEHLTEQDLIPKHILDFETKLSPLTLQTLEQFNILEPFGIANSSPRFVSRGLTIAGVPTLMGAEKQHISMKVTDGSSEIRTVGWRKAEHYTTFRRPNISIDMAFYPEINDYNNVRSVQLTLEEFRVNERSLQLAVYPPSDTSSSGRIVDSRNKNKKEYLLDLFNQDTRSIIYVHCPDKIEQLLTHVVPELSGSIGRHYQTTSLEDEIELLVKLNSREYVSVVSSGTFSSASLESVPNIDDVVLCHLSLQLEDFVNRCKPIQDTRGTTMVHLLYNNETDVQLLQDAYKKNIPDKLSLKLLYQQLQETAKNDFIDVETLRMACENSTNGIIDLGLTIFEELVFIERKIELEREFVRLIPSKRTDLQKSKTYLKCEWLLENSQDFLKFQLHENIQQIWRRVKDEC